MELVKNMELTNNVKISKLFGYLSTLIGKDHRKAHQASAYRRASAVIGELEEDICRIKNWRELDDIPYIGEVIGKDIIEYCSTGKFPYFESILKNTDPLEIFKLADGIGEEKAKDLMELMGIFTFDDLLKEFKKKRISYFLGRESLALESLSELLHILPSWLTYKTREEAFIKEDRPSIIELLDWDKEFRIKYPFETDEYARYVINMPKGRVVFTYSHSFNAENTHSIGDWVNVRYEQGDHALNWVILTSKFGKSKGKRIVMGEIEKPKSFSAQI